LGTFSTAGCRPFPGLVMGERVIAIEAIFPCVTLLDVLDEWQSRFAILRDVASVLAASPSSQLARQLRPLGELTTHAPIPRPRTVYCSGANYKKHIVDLIV